MAWRSGRRPGFVDSLLRLIGLDWTVPDFSTLSRRQKTLAVNIPYRGSKGPLLLLIDSTCINIPRPCNLAVMEWVSPPRPRRDEYALYEVAGPAAHGMGL